MKKVLYIVLMMVMIFSLSGCTKCIGVDTSTVKVKVVDKYYRSQRITPVRNGKSMRVITTPAVYKIVVEYNEEKYTLHGSTTYNKYSDRIGEYVNGTLKTYQYDDGSVKYSIVGLE